MLKSNYVVTGEDKFSRPFSEAVNADKITDSGKAFNLVPR